MRLDNVADNIVAQLACAHAGVGILTVRNQRRYKKIISPEAAILGASANPHQAL